MTDTADRATQDNCRGLEASRCQSIELLARVAPMCVVHNVSERRLSSPKHPRRTDSRSAPTSQALANIALPCQQSMHIADNTHTDFVLFLHAEMNRGLVLLFCVCACMGNALPTYVLTCIAAMRNTAELHALHDDVSSCSYVVEHAFGLSASFSARCTLAAETDPSGKLAFKNATAAGSGKLGEADIAALLDAVKSDDVYRLRISEQGKTGFQFASTKAVRAPVALTV